MNEEKELLKRFVEEMGGDLFGVADLKKYENEFVKKKLKKGIDRAIVVGVRLSSEILEDIEDHPTQEYYHHYRHVNMLLDSIALRVTIYIQRKGFRAYPVPASQIKDWEKQKALLSHKHLAYLAGLGWIGRNNLLVNPEFGAQVRLVSILTDLPLPLDTPLFQDCGSCVKCLSVCPVDAISLEPSHFNHLACFMKLKEFVKMKYVGQYICGICVKACNGGSHLTEKKE